ncbi:MAG: hypothetical protein JWR50_607 [Mucilaginibacter sp.]|nr:hypothetical protein [Mucilaginibacter sp.]
MNTNPIQTLLAKYRLYAEIALVLIVIIFGYIIYNNNQKTAAAKQTQNLKDDAKTGFNVPVTTAKLTDGKKHTGGNTDKNTFSQNDIKNNPSASLGGADTSAMALQVQRDQITYWVQVAEQTKGDNLKALKLIDSLKRKVLYYQDKFIRIAYHPGKDSTDNGTFDYKNNEHLTITQYVKKNWLLGKNHHYIDIMSDNPNTSIAGVRSLTIQSDQNNFGLRANVKAVYDFASGRVIPSAGVLVNAGSFEFGGRYYYNYGLQKFTPIVSAAYNFINIK